MLELREEKLQELKSSVRESLMRFTSNQGQYKELMRDLMVEVCFSHLWRLLPHPLCVCVVSCFHWKEVVANPYRSFHVVDGDVAFVLVEDLKICFLLLYIPCVHSLSMYSLMCVYVNMCIRVHVCAYQNVCLLCVLFPQAMEKLHEPSLQVVVRAEDQNIAKSVLKDAEKKYRERNDRSTELELSTKTIPNTENYPK